MSVASTIRPVAPVRVDQREQDRGGDVVGKVAGDAERPLGGERREIEVEEVGVHERDVRRNARLQRRDHVAVELDGREPRDPRRQPQRQRAGAGPDLEEAIVGCGVDRRDELVRPRGLEEVLAETLSRPRTDRHHHTSSSDSPRQYFSSISSISSSLIPK